MKQNTIILIAAIFLYTLLIVWMRYAHVNTYQTHVVTPVVIDKWHYPVKHRYKGRRWIDTCYMMCVKSPNYGCAHISVDDITYNNHTKKDTLLFEWTNKRLSVFNPNYDQGLLMDFTFVVLLSIMLGCIIFWVCGSLLCEIPDKITK